MLHKKYRFEGFSHRLWPAKPLRKSALTPTPLPRGEGDARMEFGDACTRYTADMPAFFPRLGVKVHA
jgi:hypothetical protein